MSSSRLTSLDISRYILTSFTYLICVNDFTRLTRSYRSHVCEPLALLWVTDHTLVPTFVTLVSTCLNRTADLAKCQLWWERPYFWSASNLTGFLAILCPASLAAICRGKKKPAGIRRKKHQNWISHERRRWLVEKGLDPPTSASANDRISALCKSDNLWSLPSAICS